MRAEWSAWTGTLTFLGAHILPWYMRLERWGKAGEGGREWWPGPLCACSQTPPAPPPESGKPQPRGTVPRQVKQAGATKASWLPSQGVGAGLRAPVPPAKRAEGALGPPGSPRARGTTPPHAQARRRGGPRRDDRAPCPRRDCPALAAAQHRGPPTGDRRQAPPAPHQIGSHRRRRPFFAWRTPARTHVRPYAPTGVRRRLVRKPVGTQPSSSVHTHLRTHAHRRAGPGR